MLAQALVGNGIVTAKKGDLLVLAIPRGGVVVGAEVARRLQAPLDVWLARKIGAPGNPELALGSVSSHGELFLDQQIIAALGVSRDFLENAVAVERRELERRMQEFRGHAEPVQVEGRTVVLVDDGVATGATAFSALAALRRGGARERILAVPVAPLDTVQRLQEAADRVLILHPAPFFYAVGQFYEQFGQVSDAEVIRLLSEFLQKNK